MREALHLEREGYPRPCPGEARRQGAGGATRRSPRRLRKRRCGGPWDITTLQDAVFSGHPLAPKAHAFQSAEWPTARWSLSSKSLSLIHI
eukprot:4967865-Pyramimonas_sp.AAC.1